MWARIENKIVMEFTDVDPAGRYDPSYVWKSCDNTVKEGWIYTGGVFITPAIEPEPTIEDIKNLRRMSYANPCIGSDYLFSQSARMKEMGEEGWEVVKEQAIQRFLEIQAEYPWGK